MKYSDKIADELIDRYTSANIAVSFCGDADDSWELTRSPVDRPYKVYIRYDDPRDVEMAIVSDSMFSGALSQEEKQTIASDEAFTFKFLALITELENVFGDLSLRERKRIVKKFEAKFSYTGSHL